MRPGKIRRQKLVINHNPQYHFINNARCHRIIIIRQADDTAAAFFAQVHIRSINLGNTTGNKFIGKAFYRQGNRIIFRSTAQTGNNKNQLKSGANGLFDCVCDSFSIMISIIFTAKIKIKICKLFYQFFDLSGKMRRFLGGIVKSAVN